MHTHWKPWLTIRHNRCSKTNWKLRHFHPVLTSTILTTRPTFIYLHTHTKINTFACTDSLFPSPQRNGGGPHTHTRPVSRVAPIHSSRGRRPVHPCPLVCFRTKIATGGCSHERQRGERQSRGRRRRGRLPLQLHVVPVHVGRGAAGARQAGASAHPAQTLVQFVQHAGGDGRRQWGRPREGRSRRGLVPARQLGEARAQAEAHRPAGD